MTLANQQPEFTHGMEIAIVGIGCRLPGGANSPAAFWQLLTNGVDAVREVPDERWDGHFFHHPDSGRAGKSVSRWGGFVDHIEHFDARFFGISPREAARIDPQQRLLLECAWEALEDGGQVQEKLAGTDVGVFVGISTYDYAEIQHGMNDREFISAYTNTGGALSIAANRISYLFDLRGPSMVVDTACSSSLVALHLALRSLANGECSMALCGGVNAILKPESTIGFSRASMLSPDGRCKTFDARANGYVRGEGAGMVTLKPLARALADGDPIYAVVRGSAVNQDGHTNGMTVPGRDAQEAMLRAAYRAAGIAPSAVRYVEAHGTGTPVGDPIETNALGAVLSAGRAEDDVCVIGSVKTNIGHLEAGAGIAGLIKAALVLKHGVVPPNLHFQSPNPDIPFDELQLRVATKLEPLTKRGGPAVAGVNSFGFGGTNAHVVLQEAPHVDAHHASTNGAGGATAPDRVHVLPLTARSPEALNELAEIYRERLDDGAAASIRDLCYNASLRRNHHDLRLAVTGASPAALVEQLDAFLAGETRPGLSSGRRSGDTQPKLVFVFSGMGPQWWAMGRQLLAQEPLFRRTVEEVDALFAPLAGWSLLDAMLADEASSRMAETEVAQPANFALQLGLARLWQSWGIEPDAIVGHSAGEVAAAYAAGALDLPAAVRVIFHRSRLQQMTSGLGKMAAAGLPLEAAQRLVAEYSGRVSVAAINSPSSVTLSGDGEALAAIGAQLEAQRVFFRMLRVDVPYHSHHMETIHAELLASLADLPTHETPLPLYSTVTGDVIDGRAVDAAYWWRNVREPVYFAAATARLLEEDHAVFLELSPHPVLAGSISECMQKQKRKGTVISSLRRQEGERAMLLGALGALYTQGYTINWAALYPDGGHFTPLPSYPWQRERYWQESPVSAASRLGKIAHPLLGLRMESAQPTWEQEVDTHLLPFLDDHRIQGTVVYPGAAYVEMALAAAREIHGHGPRVLEAIEFQKALFLGSNPPKVQMILDPEAATFQIHSRSSGQTGWQRHAVGSLATGDGSAAPRVKLDALLSRCTEDVTERCYVTFQAQGLEYGPNFQGIRQLRQGTRESVGQVTLPEALHGESGAYVLHPALLDASFQVLLGALIGEDGDERVYLPVRIDRLRFHARPGAQIWCHARLTEHNDDFLEGDIVLCDEEGNTFVEIRGFRCHALETGQQTTAAGQEWRYEYRWQPVDAEAQRMDATLSLLQSQASWLLFVDGGNLGSQLADLLAAYGQSPILVSPGDGFARIDEAHFQVAPHNPDDFKQLIDVVRSDFSTCRGIVHLWSLDTPDDLNAAALDTAQTTGCLSLLHLAQALAAAEWPQLPRLWLVTQGAQEIGVADRRLSPAQATLWGLGRVIANEYPRLRSTRVDLSHSDAPQELGQLFNLLWADDGEEEIVVSGDARYVPRLHRLTEDDDTAQRKTVQAAPGQPFFLDNARPGVLSNLTLRETVRRAPGPDEVEIEVLAAGLNFRDVMKGMGIYPTEQGDLLVLGDECAGRIVAVGANVDRLKVGDEVVAIAPGCFSAYVTTPAAMVVPKPAHMTFAEAATIPIVFLTAYYALHHLGRMRAGERVLIHSAAGGVGMAAVQLAQQAGAEIFATAGSPEKREFLRSLGVKYVMDSRSLDFADEVMAYTNGDGVDLVLNSLAGDAIPKSLSVLGAYGRFLEIGKRDIYQNSKLGLSPFRNNLSFFAIDLGRLFEERPDATGEMLQEVMRFMETHGIRPLPHRVFPIGEAVDAFRFMAQAKHIGKIVLSFEDRNVEIAPAARQIVPFAEDAAYLVTGGLSGFGLAVAQWMVQQGARHLVLVSRSGKPAEDAAPILAEMEATGAQIVVAKADVTQEEAVADLLAQIAETLPPLRGVVHAAAVYDDAFIFQLNRQRFDAVLAPKIKGAWHLHSQTRDLPLDFFVLFSSFTSLVGNPGQANYVAANAFLDALAHYRHAQGLPALTVNWGAIAEVGYLTRHQDVADHFTRQGLTAFTPQQATQVLADLLNEDRPQVGVIDIDWAQWGRFAPQLMQSPRFAHLASAAEDGSSAETQRGGTSLRSQVLSAEDRHALLVEKLSEQIAVVLGASASTLDIDRPLTDFGLDSIMAVELSHWIGDKLDIDLPTMVLIQTPSIRDLATEILSELAPAESPLESTVTELQEAVLASD